MRFRVTSVAGSVEGARLNPITVSLEDLLNAELGSSEFGSSIAQFTLVLVAVQDEPAENESFAEAHRKLGTAKNPFTGEALRYLSVAVPIPPSMIAARTDRELQELVASHIAAVLSDRPARIPKGLAFPRLAQSVLETLAASGRVA